MLSLGLARLSPSTREGAANRGDTRERAEHHQQGNGADKQQQGDADKSAI